MADETIPERQLILLRHGKAERGIGKDDFDRELAPRGEAESVLMGEWLRDNALVPDCVLSSPAARAAATAEHSCEASGVGSGIIRYDRRIYLASVEALNAVIAAADADSRRLMIVGHNPGLEMLLLSLVGPRQLADQGGGQMPTAALAVIDLTIGWASIGAGMGQLAAFIAPRDLR